MLVSATINNWLSFKDETTFSMVASLERQHKERVPQVKKYDVRILPVAAIYGGNASGKTNFFKALHFAQAFIIRGSQIDGLIPVEPFSLTGEKESKPSCFGFEILIDETIYDYSFSVTSQRVLEEKLVKITSRSERTLFHRSIDKLELNNKLADHEFLNFAFRGTRDNQLFLTNSVSQNVNVFSPVYSWFKDSLVLIAPDSRFEPFERFFDEGHPLFSTMNKLLPLLDTGITKIGGEKVSTEQINLPDVIKETVKEGQSVRLHNNLNSERLIISRNEGELEAQKLVTYHSSDSGNPVKFEMSQESDGSQRIIDLLPAFLDLAEENSNKVYVIDELDRSLHTLMSRNLIEMFLDSCGLDSRSQLLFTTHDALVMDQSILRRDEMWVAERRKDGGSTLVSFSEFKDIRKDKDVRKSYLQGRFGGVPKLFISHAAEGDC